jgi:hypothetical protein
MVETGCAINMLKILLLWLLVGTITKKLFHEKLPVPVQ